MSGGWTFDAGPLVALGRDDRRAWAFVKGLWGDRVVPVVPTPVLVEVWRGKTQARLAQALKGCRIEPLDAVLARRAGELCGLTGGDDPADAVVVASAAKRWDTVLTSDRHDLEHLAACTPGVRVRSMNSV